MSPVNYNYLSYS